MTATLHPLDDHPPEDAETRAIGCSVEVLLVYADGHTAKSYRDGWTGWMVWRDGLPWALDDDDAGVEQPVGWRLP